MDLKAISSRFRLPGEVVDISPYGNGHINGTYLVKNLLADGETKRFILQKINHHVFRKPEQLMENVQKVTAYLREIIIRDGGDPERETLNVILTQDGQNYCQDDKGDFWRMYKFVEDTISYDQVKSPEDFYESAYSFGHFQHLLKDFKANTLHEVIKDFHNTKVRFAALKAAMEHDPCHRLKNIQSEIDFVFGRETEVAVLVDLLDRKELPLRVTHNDTKLNNVLLDSKTGKAICVIDLDTVMPGSALYDFGDAIRFGTNTAVEDETDLTKVSCDLELFEAFVKGYLKGCAGSLTAKELEYLPMGAKIMTLECGIRFLTDYLEGDVYFKIHREGHNLDRCRTQFKLVQDMEDKYQSMMTIVGKYAYR